MVSYAGKGSVSVYSLFHTAFPDISLWYFPCDYKFKLYISERFTVRCKGLSPEYE